MENPELESFGKLWSALSAQRRAVVILVTAAVFIAILLLARGAGTKDMSLLFGGLEPAAAGDVLAALEQQGVVYEVRGSAIYVPSSSRDSLRMALAGQGLPATGSQGYELLDSLSGFSTTAQMFDAAYWRAKEGELARTIVASPHIRAARVHISTPSRRAFQRSPAQTAAVTVTTTGAALSNQQIKALQYLIGSAVPGLSPADVAVIDDDGGLLTESEDGSGTNINEQAENMRKRAERLLAARVGAGNAVVEVTIDPVTELESITERSVEPESRIAISTEVTESTGNSTDDRGGSVTVASNLPAGSAASGGGTARNENSESRTLTNYEVSQTERQLTKAPGAIKRLSVAVLVNEITQVAADGSETTIPRSAEELADLEALVASAVGIDTERGDIITLKSLPFEPFQPLGTEVVSPVSAQPLDLMKLIQIGVLAVVALVLGLFVVRPILSAPPTHARPLEIEDRPPPRDVSPAGKATIAGVNSEAMAVEAIHDNGLNPEDPVARLKRIIGDREPETLQVLQDWIDAPETSVGS